MRTLKSDSRCLRFSSYEPNRVSIPSSGTVMRFIRWTRLLSHSPAKTYDAIIPDYGCVFKCSSVSCRASTGDGAPAIRSTALEVLGNAITSRIDDSHAGG